MATMVLRQVDATDSVASSDSRAIIDCMASEPRSRKALMLRVDPDLHGALESAASLTGVSVNALADTALRSYLSSSSFSASAASYRDEAATLIRRLSGETTPTTGSTPAP